MYMYQLLSVAIPTAASRTMCSLGAAVIPVPLAHSRELFVDAEPPLSQRLKCLIFIATPLGHNMKHQYSFEEQIMQLQLSNNIESH
jgi:hypothetical protein